ncbi:MAG TPA: hypothetical protein V6D10_16120 [Trichocoleus sp.]|jgi:hypothetical protein
MAHRPRTQLTAYEKRLQPWCIVRRLPDMRSIEVERFRCRGRAESYLNQLKRLLPRVDHLLIFDPGDLETVEQKQTLPTLEVDRASPIVG